MSIPRNPTTRGNECDPIVLRDYQREALGRLAAALDRGVRRALSHIERRSGRSLFVFQPDTGIAVTAARYYTSNLGIDARAFADALRGLKAALHAEPVAR